MTSQHLNSPAAMADAAFVAANNQLIMQQRDQQLASQHRRDWALQKKAVFVEPPLELRHEIRARQAAIDQRATDLTAQATARYKAALADLKARYREGEFTRDYVETEEHRLHREWNDRRLEIADVFVHRFADTNLAQAQEVAHTVTTETSDAVWAAEGPRILALFRLPADPDWAASPDVAEQDSKPARRRAAR